MRWFALILMMTSAAMLLAGCARNAERDRADMPTVVMPVLEIDPVDMPAMPEWFTNTAITINFQPSGHYRKYAGLNRHDDAVERGRWIRLNYVSVSLEPYAVGRAAQPTRGTLFRADDDKKTLMLRLPPTKEGEPVPPLRALAGPPRVIQDELFGMWEGGGATLELRRDMRFVYSREGESSGPASLAGIAGNWHATDERLVLQPDAPAVAPMTFDVTSDDGATVLVSEAGELHRP